MTPSAALIPARIPTTTLSRSGWSGEVGQKLRGMAAVRWRAAESRE